MFKNNTLISAVHCSAMVVGSQLLIIVDFQAVVRMILLAVYHLLLEKQRWVDELDLNVLLNRP